MLLMDGYPGLVGSHEGLDSILLRTILCSFVGLVFSKTNFWISPNPSYMLSNLAFKVCPIKGVLYNSLYGTSVLMLALSITKA